MRTVSRNAIAADLEEIGQGGEAVVFRIRSQPRRIFKEYRPKTLTSFDLAQLISIIDFPSSLDPDERSWLLQRTTWPEEVVVASGNACGFVMSEIPDAFRRRHGLASNPRRVDCGWNYLAYRSEAHVAAMLSEIPSPSDQQIVELLLELARTIELLHRHHIVLGDISGNNLLWSIEPTELLIIDCDSFRFEGTQGPSGHKESPGWMDPYLRGGPTSGSSDVYKLGVAAFRSLWSDPRTAVTADAVRSSMRPDVPRALHQLIEESVVDGTRPTASDWVRTLEDLYRYGGRPVLRAAPIPPVAPTPPRPILRSHLSPPNRPPISTHPKPPPPSSGPAPVGPTS